MSESERRLIVTRHAVAAYSRRRNISPDLRVLAEVDWNLRALRRRGYQLEDQLRLIALYNELEQEIRECVSYSLANGLAMDHKPKGFVLYGRRNNQLPPGQRFVRCDEDSNFGFIVKREPPTEGSPGEDVVITTLTKAGVRR